MDEAMLMDRRAFIGLTTALWSASLAAQPAPAPRRIGILSGGTLPSAGLAEQMARYGWVEGRNLVIERRSARGDAQLAKALAKELVRSNVEVIVTIGAVASLAARDATTTIPIVSRTGDPVLLGLVTNLAHPGGNITGNMTVSRELSTKRLEVLRALLPNVVRVAELVDPANEYVRRTRSEYEQAFAALGMQPIFVEVPEPTQLGLAFERISSQRAQALVVRGDPVFEANREQIIRLAMQLELPTMTEGRLFVESGALASYAPNFAAMNLRTAALVDKILRGAQPANLPIEQPTEFEFLINLKTAKVLALDIPPSLLQRADGVIQ